MGSSSGPSSNTNQQTSGSSSSFNGFGSTTTQGVPDWVNQSSYDTTAFGSQLIGAYDPRNPLVTQAAGNAQGFGALVNPSMQGASDLFNSDRGGGYAQTAIERLLAMGGGPGSTGSGAYSRGPGAQLPSNAIRDANWRNFTDYDMGAYSSPYTSQVVDATLGDMSRANEIAGLTRQGAATRAGAYGGSRHGVADAVAQGEYARAVGATSAGLRDQAFTRAADLIGRDQAGDLSAQQGNQQADAAELNSATSIANANTAAGASVYSANRSAELGALQAALGGGINLGQLDLARGGALQGLGEGAQDRLSSMGLNLAQLDKLPFDMTMSLGNMMSGLPFSRTNTTNGFQFGANESTGTMEGSQSQERDNAAFWGGMLLSSGLI